MDSELFIMMSEKSLPVHVNKRAKRFYERVQEVFGESLTERNLDDKEAIRNIFYLTSPKLGKSNFYHMKRLVILLYEELYKEGLVEAETVAYVKDLRFHEAVDSGELEASYFKSLPSLIAFIRTVGHMNEFNDNELMAIKACSILLWKQVPVSDIVKVKKMFLTPKFIICCGKQVKLTPEEYTIFATLKETVNYRGFPTGRKMKYVDSEYLFRSSVNEQLTVNAIKCMYRDFNVVAVKYGKVLMPAVIALNGMFDEIRTHRSDGSLVQQISREYGHDHQVSSAYGKLFEKWIQLYWG